MDGNPPLHACLGEVGRQNPGLAAAAAVIEALAAAATQLSRTIAAGPLVGITGQANGVNSGGDTQKDIDLAADRMMLTALRSAPVAAVLSEESELPEELDRDAPLCVAIDPLDGSANLENNI